MVVCVFFYAESKIIELRFRLLTKRWGQALSTILSGDLPANWVSFEGKGRFFRLPGEVRAIFGSELSVHRHLSLCDIGLRTDAHEKFREYRIICDFYEPSA
jgi:hypothetical protein